jgi:hypothetical protein
VFPRDSWNLRAMSGLDPRVAGRPSLRRYVCFWDQTDLR